MASGGDGCAGWDNSGCEGSPYCPPRCPRFVDARGTPLLVRPIEETAVDADALLSLYDRGAATDSVAYPPYVTTSGLADWLSDVLADGWNVVATRDGRPVGHAILVPAAATVPEFGVFVHPDHRGRGIAGELLRHAIAHAADAGCEAVVMSVEAGNGAMRSIADEHGFDVVETPGADDWVGFVTYRLALARVSPVERIGPLTVDPGG